MYVYADNYRIYRVSQEIHRVLSVILQHDLSDPRIGIPTISEVSVSRDLKCAKIFITFLDKNDVKDIQEAIFALQHASRFVRCLLADRMYLRIIPILMFIYDSSFIQGNKIYGLIKKLNILHG